jgi:hypothetical protein
MATVNEERKEKQLIISGEQLEKAISDIAELKKSLENTGDLSGVPELQEQVNTIEANLKKINDLAVTDSVEISSVKIRLGNLEENTYTKEETDSTITAKVSEIVADAPEDFDTLKEMSDWLTEHSDSAATMNSDIANLKTGISEHTASIEALEENLPKVYEDVTAETNEKLVLLEANIGANAEAIEALETDILLLKENALMKNQGAENVGKILVVGTDGNLVLTYMPEGGTSGDVTGYLDTDNNIRLSGNLASGRYTLKYEYEDGTVAEVGTIEVGAIPEPTEPTNFADTSSSDWLTDYRLSFNGTELTTKELTGAICTNFVADIQTDDIVRVEGIDFTDTNNRQALVKENGTIIAVDNATNLPGYSTHITNVTYDSNTLQFTVANTEQLKKLRFSGTLTGTADDVKITITRNGTVL